MPNIDSRTVREFSQSVIVLAAVTRANARIAAMTAENQSRERQGLAQAYGEEQFMRVLDEEDIGYNHVIEQIKHI